MSNAQRKVANQRETPTHNLPGFLHFAALLTPESDVMLRVRGARPFRAG
jgi:hypothetical protein